MIRILKTKENDIIAIFKYIDISITFIYKEYAKDKRKQNKIPL
jgi:hypothetical protein